MLKKMAKITVAAALAAGLSSAVLADEPVKPTKETTGIGDVTIDVDIKPGKPVCATCSSSLKANDPGEPESSPRPERANKNQRPPRAPRDPS